MSAAANEALVRRAIEAIWLRGDLDVADEVFAGDYVDHNGLLPDLVVGPEAIKVRAALYRVAFPDLDVIVEQLSADEDMVVLRWTARSRATDAPAGAPGRSLAGITRCRLACGKISESWTAWEPVSSQPRR